MDSLSTALLLTLLSTLGSTEESSLFGTWKNECFGFRECAECHFPREHLSVFLWDFPLDHDPLLLLAPPLSTGRSSCVSSFVGRREKKSLEHESRMSFRSCVDELSPGRSIVIPNGLYYFDLLDLWIVGFAWVGIFCESLLFFFLWTILIYCRYYY